MANYKEEARRWLEEDDISMPTKKELFRRLRKRKALEALRRRKSPGDILLEDASKNSKTE